MQSWDRGTNSDHGFGAGTAFQGPRGAAAARATFEKWGRGYKYYSKSQYQLKAQCKML